MALALIKNDVLSATIWLSGLPWNRSDSDIDNGNADAPSGTRHAVALCVPEPTTSKPAATDHNKPTAR